MEDSPSYLFKNGVRSDNQTVHTLLLAARLHEAGVNGGRFDLARFVALTATTPARLFGLDGRKGRVAPGLRFTAMAVFPPRLQRRGSAQRFTQEQRYRALVPREELRSGRAADVTQPERSALNAPRYLPARDAAPVMGTGVRSTSCPPTIVASRT